MRRKPRWQSGDVRNIDDCSENGINETFESKETYKPDGIDHHVSAIKLWETSLLGVTLFGGLLQICGSISGRLALEGYAVALLGLQQVSKVVLAFQWRCVHFCNIICLFRCSTTKMIITVLSPPTVLHKLGRSSSNFMISLVRSWPLLVERNFRFPAKFIVCLAPKLTSLSHRVKFKSFPRESIPFVVSSNRSWRPRD